MAFSAPVERTRSSGSISMLNAAYSMPSPLRCPLTFAASSLADSFLSARTSMARREVSRRRACALFSSSSSFLWLSLSHSSSCPASFAYAISAAALCMLRVRFILRSMPSFFSMRSFASSVSSAEIPPRQASAMRFESSCAPLRVFSMALCQRLSSPAA
ncbi:hypothetical protein SDC9_174083 [bioreactor metagenome]|uniref:Uncharacterized protein n=1 Tax=bioreactor metagenome TaxID=1076179 RepID=A0A645GIA9_9ZZZZ